MTIFKFLRGGKPTLEQVSTEVSEMRDMLEEIQAITENYLEGQMEEAARYCWDRKEQFVTFGDAFRSYMEQRK